MEHAHVFSTLLNMQNEQDEATEDDTSKRNGKMLAPELVPIELAPERAQKQLSTGVSVAWDQQQQQQQRPQHKERNEDEWSELLADKERGDDELFVESGSFSSVSPFPTSSGRKRCCSCSVRGVQGDDN